MRLFAVFVCVCSNFIIVVAVLFPLPHAIARCICSRHPNIERVLSSYVRKDGAEEFRAPKTKGKRRKNVQKVEKKIRFYVLNNIISAVCVCLRLQFLYWDKKKRKLREKEPAASAPVPAPTASLSSSIHMQRVNINTGNLYQCDVCMHMLHVCTVCRNEWLSFANEYVE